MGIRLDCNNYRLSISAKHSAVPAFPYTNLRYLLTHSMRWSLKVPLMSRCKMSGAMSWQMSTQGKLLVNGWKNADCGSLCTIEEFLILTDILLSMPHSSQASLGEKTSNKASVSTRVLGGLPASRSSGSEKHLHEHKHEIRYSCAINHSYLPH